MTYKEERPEFVRLLCEERITYSDNLLEYMFLLEKELSFFKGKLEVLQKLLMDKKND